MAVGVVGATGMEEVEAEAVEGVKVMEQEVVGEGQGMEVRKVTLSTRLSYSSISGSGSIGGWHYQQHRSSNRVRTSYSLNRISKLHETDFSGEVAGGEQRLQPIEEGERKEERVQLKEEREKREERRDERERRVKLSPGREADADTPRGEG